MEQEFVFVSSVKGKLVTRFPSLRQPVAQYIGATRKGKEIVWNPEAVVAIPLQEWNKYRREYRRALEQGSLKKRTEADHKAWLQKQKQADEEAKRKAEEASRKAETEAKEAEAKSETEAKEAEQQTSEAEQAPADAASPEQQGNQELSKAEAPTKVTGNKAKRK